MIGILRILDDLQIKDTTGPYIDLSRLWGCLMNIFYSVTETKSQLVKSVSITIAERPYLNVWEVLAIHFILIPYMFLHHWYPEVYETYSVRILSIQHALKTETISILVGDSIIF